jgi:hypothetical protein
MATSFFIEVSSFKFSGEAPVFPSGMPNRSGNERKKREKQIQKLLFRGYAFVIQLSGKSSIADSNRFVYSLFVKNVPHLSIGDKNVFATNGPEGVEPRACKAFS